MRFGATSLILRVGVFVLLAGIIGLFQMDRASAERASLAEIVPIGLGGEADRKRAQIYATSDPEIADEATRQLLRHRPIPATHLSLRAYTLVENDRIQEGGEALSVAAKRGWRDRYTQVMVLASALANDNWLAAAQRLEAMMRGRDEWQIQIAAARQVLEIEDARKVFAERFLESPQLSNHLTNLVQRDRTLAPDAARTFIDARAQGAEVPCEEAATIGHNLLVLTEVDLALGLWLDGCGSREELDDFRLQFGDEDGGPFAWQFQRGDGVATKPGREDDSITVVNRSPASKLVAFRYAVLGEGSHRFRLDYDQQESGRVGGNGETELLMKCGNRESPLFIQNEANAEGEYLFVVPEDCPLQFLGLTTRRGRASDLKLTKL